MASDLHIHTAFSDGRLAPEEILATAKAAGLNYISITDHDTADGIKHLYEKGLYPSKSLRVIPGIEFSTDLEGHNVHILGYDFDFYSSEMADKINELNESRWVRFSQIVQKLVALGVDLSEGDVLQFAGMSRSIGRAHIARAMVKKGLVANIREAFDKYLQNGRPAYVPHYRLQPTEAVALIRGAGGVPVLAHPKLIGDDNLVERLLTQLDFGGLEVFYPEHDEADTAKYQDVADAHGLLLTGGSDFHALPNRYPEELGAFTVDDVYAQPFFNPPKALV